MGKVSKADKQVVSIIEDYGWGAMAAMVAVPLPVVDMGATLAVWGAMIVKIAGAYGYDMELEDAKRLSSDLFKSVILTTAAWFGSAKTASLFLKFIPGAGTVTAYIIDAAIAGIGAKTITARLGSAAAAYFKSGKKIAPETLKEHVKNVVGNPKSILTALAAVAAAESIDDVDPGDDMDV